MKTTILLIALSIMTIGTDAATRTVRVSGGDYTSVSAAVAASNDGDVVDVLGDFTETSMITISKSITIQGGGTTNTSITRSNASNTTRLFIASTAGKSLVIKDLTLKQGAFTGTDIAMAIYCTGASSSLTLDNVVFNGFNSGIQSAGALWISDLGTCSITNCEFINNTTTSTGGAIWITGAVSGTGSNLTKIDRCTFEGNNASNANSGHAICIYNMQAQQSLDSILINNSTFFNNGAVDNVGATIRLQYNGARIGVKNCTFANNKCFSTASDIFTNPVVNSIASKLTVIGNLFYKSGGMIINNGTAASGTYTQWSGWNYYNFSTTTLTEGIYMTKLGNMPSLTPDASGGLQLEYNSGTGMAILANNGGKVRTIKLLGTNNTENKAINGIPAIYKQNSLDACELTRKIGTTDAGAYEMDGVVTGLNSSKADAANGCYYDATNNCLRLGMEVSGLLTVYSISGEMIQQIQMNNSSICTIGKLSKGVYVISMNKNGSLQKTKIVVF